MTALDSMRRVAAAIARAVEHQGAPSTVTMQELAERYGGPAPQLCGYVCRFMWAPLDRELRDVHGIELAYLRRRPRHGRGHAAIAIRGRR